MSGRHSRGRKIFGALAKLKPAQLTLERLQASPNPTGMKIGFWEVYNKQSTTLSSFGKRPTSRVGFVSWDTLEQSPGVYTFDSVPDSAFVHQYGEQVMNAVNISFNQSDNLTIPTFYTPDITVTATRNAAKNFLTAYVQYMLNTVGQFILTIDYEIISNWRLGGTGAARNQRANAWAAWYTEAVATAKAAANALGKGSMIKFQPIVNGDVLQSPSLVQGADQNPWLVAVMEASDYLAIDSYFSDPARPADDPTYFIETIAFWVQEFSLGKPVHITENGFTTITEIDDTVTRETRQYKWTGTEAQQATYYSQLFPQLLAANLPGGVFNNQVRAYHMWSVRDYPQSNDPEKIYFGLVRSNDTEKPSAPIVRNAIVALEDNDFSAPYLIKNTAANARVGSSNPLTITYTDGDNFQFLRYTDRNLPSGSSYQLRATAQLAGHVLIYAGGSWSKHTIAAGAISITLAANRFTAGVPNSIDIYFTDSYYPHTQVITNIQLFAV